MILNNNDKQLLETITDLHSVPQGAYNIRKDGQSVSRQSSSNISIESLDNKNSGLKITVKNNTKNESVHIPVILSQVGIKDIVENNFVIGDNCDILIVAGCGIHATSNNKTNNQSEHSGIHKFFIGQNSKVRYVEKHYAKSNNKIKSVFNPITEIYVGKNSIFQMESIQFDGVDFSDRKVFAKAEENAVINVIEKISTSKKNLVKTYFKIDLDGKNSASNIVSRSVAKGESVQDLVMIINGNNKCFGHSECDAITMDNAKVSAVPEINSKNCEASLVHEAAIGKIAGEQIVKLMTLGMTEEEATEKIIAGFLK